MLGLEPTPFPLNDNVLRMLRENKMTQLYVAESSAGDENAARLAEAMRGNTSLKSLALDNRRISDHGIVPIARMLAENRSLQELILNRNPLNDPGGRNLAEGLRKNTSLVRLSLYLDTMGMEGYEAISRAIVESGSKNFIELNSFAPHAGVDTLAARNLAALERLADVARNPAACGAEDLFEAQVRHNAFTYKYFNQQFGRDFLKLLDGLPSLPGASAENAYEALFTPREDGFAPLDNPSLWRDKEQARQVLARIPLTKESLARRTEKGASLLESLARSVDAEVLVGTLNRQGIQLGKRELLDGEGGPNPVLSALIDRRAVRPLFSPENWSGRESAELAAVHQALPPSLQDVGYQALRQQLVHRATLARGR